MYKIAILDIDGTLVNSRGKLSPKTISAIKKIRQRGVKVAICTGRNLRKTMPVIKKLAIDAPIACIDGTFLYNPEKKEIFSELTLEKPEIKAMLDIAADLKLYVELSNEDKYYKYISSKEMLKYDIYNKHTPIGAFKSFFGGVRYVYKYDKLYELNDNLNLYQLCLAGEKDALEVFRERLGALKLADIDVRDNILDGYFYISKKGVCKERGMRLICEYFGLNAAQALAIGDESNDLDMLEAAGMGVAMGNAKAEVKAVSDFVTLSNDEDGAAKALEKFFCR